MSSVPRRTKRVLIASGIVAVALAGGIAAYFSTDSKAKERPGARAPQAVPVSIAPVSKQSLPVRLQAIGNVEAFSTVAVKARVDGQIVEVKFKEGEPVRKGEALFRIDPRPFEAALRQAEANALRDSAQRDQARSQERRYQDILDKHFVSKEAYAQIRTNAETAEAVAQASQAVLETARLNLEYCTIRSPLDGYVGKVLLQVGNLVKANDASPLVVINQVKPIYATFAVPEQSLAQIRRHMAEGALEVDVSASDSAQAQLASGRLVFIDNSVDASTGTIKLRAQFDNADLALWPGQFVRVSLKLYDQHDAIVVPSTAVQTGPQGEYVYVLKPDATAEVRKVAIARTEGEVTVIANGLVTGEKVVTRGQLRLAPGVKVLVRSDPS